MRRAAVAFVVGGFALGCSPGVASADDNGTQIVSFAGYEITVPASWPVYQLASDPARCVRYDVHAVYLGAPGPDQQCPPGLVGHTGTVSISSPTVLQRAGAPAQPGLSGGRVLRSVPGVNATIIQNDASHQIRVALRDTGEAIATATYGSTPDNMVGILATLRRAPAGTAAMVVRIPPIVVKSPVPAASLVPLLQAATAATAPAGPAAPRPAAPPRPPAHRTATPPAPHTTPAPRITPAPRTTPTPPLPGPQPTPTPTPTTRAQVVPASELAGFDTCTAPSLRAMRAWRAKYAVVGIYIGGSNMACDYGNLSAGWVRTVTQKLGWGLLPTYVGPQAPCYGYGDMIKPAKAAAEGRAAAVNAAANAKTFGLPAKSPIYDDMEAYNEDNKGCVRAVLSYISAWTKELNTHGYLAGVYSSADSGVQDLQSAVGSTTMSEPQAIWFALWDNRRNLADTQVLKSQPWEITDRVKQYAGGHWQKIDGVSLDIDSDLIGGPIAR
jgi:hypothetical protein